MSSPMMRHCPQKVARRKRPMLIVECVWCPEHHKIGTKPCARHLDGQITSGMCAKAEKKFQAQIKRELKAIREGGA